jgi:hypothetical protein
MFSIAAPNLIRAKVGATDDSSASSKTFLRQFVFLGGYKAKTEKMSIEPSIMMRKVFTGGFEVEFNLMSRFMEDKFVAGINYRPGSTGAFGIIVGTKMSFMELYYGYSSGAGDFIVNRNGHEVTLGLSLNRNKKQDPTTAPRKRYKN